MALGMSLTVIAYKIGEAQRTPNVEVSHHTSLEEQLAKLTEETFGKGKVCSICGSTTEWYSSRDHSKVSPSENGRTTDDPSSGGND